MKRPSDMATNSSTGVCSEHNPRGYACTRPKGHSGNHIARNSKALNYEICAEWAQDKEGLRMWMIYTRTNYCDGYSDDVDYQGPWPLDQVNAYIRLTVEVKDLSSIEFTLVPKAEEGRP